MANAILLYADMTDNELIDRVKRGQRACYELLIRRHSQALYRVGRMYGIGQSGVEELVQNIFLNAYQLLRYFEGRLTFRDRLVKTMLRQCLENADLFSDGSGMPEEVGEPAAKAISSIYYSYREPVFSGKLENSIEQLPVSLRCVYVLCEIEGCSDSEVAVLLQTSETNIRHRLNKAKAQLKTSPGKWMHHMDVYALHINSCERIINKVMGLVDAEEYSIEKALLPRD